MSQRNVGVPLLGWRYSTIDTEFFFFVTPPHTHTKYTLLTFTFSRNVLCQCCPTDHAHMTSDFPLVITPNYAGAEKKKQVALIMLIIALQFDVSTSFNM